MRKNGEGGLADPERAPAPTTVQIDLNRSERKEVDHEINELRERDGHAQAATEGSEPRISRITRMGNGLTKRDADP